MLWRERSSEATRKMDLNSAFLESLAAYTETEHVLCSDPNLPPSSISELFAIALLLVGFASKRVSGFMDQCIGPLANEGNHIGPHS